MMRVVHNQLNDPAPPPEPQTPVGAKERMKLPPKERASTRLQRQLYKDYKAALKFYAKEIAEIQKHKPGWLPKFKYANK